MQIIRHDKELDDLLLCATRLIAGAQAIGRPHAKGAKAQCRRMHDMTSERVCALFCTRERISCACVCYNTNEHALIRKITSQRKIRF